VIFVNHMAATPPRGRVTSDDDIEYCITIGNQRGRAANADGRRGQIIATFPASPNWGRYLEERYVTSLPLPPGTSALYVYAKISDVWVVQYTNTTTQPAESDELDLQANVTMQSLRDANRKLDEANALVSHREQEAAHMAARDRQLAEQVQAHEAQLQAIRHQVQSERAFLAAERDRCAREIHLAEERCHRETAALDELLSQRRQVASAEEARLQASLEAATRDMMESRNAQIAIRQQFTAAERELMDAESGAVTMIAHRRRDLQTSATAFQAQVSEMEREKLESIETMALGLAGPVERRETPGEKIANLIVEKGREVNAGELFKFAVGLFEKKSDVPT
jgi:hypothetical protein